LPRRKRRTLPEQHLAQANPARRLVEALASLCSIYCCSLEESLYLKDRLKVFWKLTGSRAKTY
jgi:hypothetical protein